MQLEEKNRREGSEKVYDERMDTIMEVTRSYRQHSNVAIDRGENILSFRQHTPSFFAQMFDCICKYAYLNVVHAKT